MNNSCLLRCRGSLSPPMSDLGSLSHENKRQAPWPTRCRPARPPRLVSLQLVARIASTSVSSRASVNSRASVRSRALILTLKLELGLGQLSASDTLVPRPALTLMPRHRPRPALTLVFSRSRASTSSRSPRSMRGWQRQPLLGPRPRSRHASHMPQLQLASAPRSMQGWPRHARTCVHLNNMHACASASAHKGVVLNNRHALGWGPTHYKKGLGWCVPQPTSVGTRPGPTHTCLGPRWPDPVGQCEDPLLALSQRTRIPMASGTPTNDVGLA